MHLHPNDPAIDSTARGTLLLTPTSHHCALLPTRDLLQLLHKHPLQRCAAGPESHTVSLGALSGVLSRGIGHSCASHPLQLLTKALPVTACLLGSPVRSRGHLSNALLAHCDASVLPSASPAPAPLPPHIPAHSRWRKGRTRGGPGPRGNEHHNQTERPHGTIVLMDRQREPPRRPPARARAPRVPPAAGRREGKEIEGGKPIAGETPAEMDGEATGPVPQQGPVASPSFSSFFCGFFF